MEPNISQVASLIGDSRRASILMALMGGKALTATELATEADITAQTASSHLTKLVNGGLLTVRKQGRHKYFQLLDYRVAQLLEDLLNISTGTRESKLMTGPSDQALRKARVCYDHLAGEVGVVLFDSLLSNGFLIENSNGAQLTQIGESFFGGTGANLNAIKKNRRPVCKACLDWSERRTHLGGSLGKWVLDDIFTHQWASKELDSRAIVFTTTGLSKFKQRYLISN